MAQFSVNAQHVDPYRQFKFRLKWEGRHVAGIGKVGFPGSPRARPGSTQCEAISFERGVTLDTEFNAWADQAWRVGAGVDAEAALEMLRKDLIVEVYNEAGQLALAYKVVRCWACEYQALPDLDGKAVAIVHMKLENAGWERDVSVPEPAAQSLAPDDDLGSGGERQ